MDIPVYMAPADFIRILKYNLMYFYFPFPISESFLVTEANLTTVCYPNTTGTLQCRCEEQYGWSCDKCATYGECSNTTTETCSCINGIPPEGQFCETITSLAPCPSQSSAASTATPTTTTPAASTATPTTTTAKVLVQSREFTMDIEFKPEYNDPSNSLFKEIDNTLKLSFQAAMTGYRSAGLVRLRSGSIIAEYTVRSTSFDPLEIIAAEWGVFTQLGEKYHIITKSSSSACITHNYTILNCVNRQKQLTCEEKNNQQFKVQLTVILSDEEFVCLNHDVFGNGKVGDKAIAPCKEDETGERTATCKASGKWEDEQNNCVLKVIDELRAESEFLDANTLPNFLERLRNVSVNFIERVVQSPANIGAIVDIVDRVANTSLSTPINKVLMENVLIVANVLSSNEAKDSWNFLNANSTRNYGSEVKSGTPKARSESSLLLLSIEMISNALTNESFEIVTQLILLNKTTFTDSFSADLNSSVGIDIPMSDGSLKFITTINFATMDNILPARNADNDTRNAINGNVVLVKSSDIINNVSFAFDVFNTSLDNPQCVFWNFSLFNDLGGWEDEGCELVRNGNETVTCNCNHLTSFSILMSPFIPESLQKALDFITYIGVGISLSCLVICLIIEAIIWRKISRNSTLYLRHVSIVNIAMSLLIADIWFIIGAHTSDENNSLACIAATFFIHLFYLALFFWMLASALLLLYRTVKVFEGGLTEKTMMGIGFSLGYGMPLIITIITIAITAPDNYIRDTGVCWLNWYESKALLAFVIPALLISVTNLVILLVMLYQVLKRRSIRDSAWASERNVLVVIARSLAVLTPFFGTTWGLGVGTMTNPSNEAIHIAFAVFNSLQGFFILVFGTLLDQRVRSELTNISCDFISRTRSNSAGLTLSSKFGFLQKRKRGRDGYNMTSGASQLFTNS
ncbi:adhesion G-protein coupled receptor F1-like [Lampris incognitus]|uniref:adhesion G-protein coupled receptor F1-like n=1 Tax=Lampris incognitus TaxID=2546036 RepID=UPI0024B57990|nr:adhesion G-protein coupled receptor F1-like [Lampris incognitus]